ncbi:MAG: LytS/YhcK type 5TM receptor domain-containing protein [Sporomusaceae bacterium]|nr:LytS/YhcK type 5TM receptor domain-containing protein [Sporomusaceae bacterium]
MGLIPELLSEMALIAMVAYLIGRNKYLVNCMIRPATFSSQLVLTLIFSSLSIMGTYNGMPIEGALANNRTVGALMGGFMGGPYVGFAVGVISGFHRYVLGGFTAETCGFATILAGLISGWVRHKVGIVQVPWKTAALVAFLVEVIQKLMVLAFAKPFEAAWALEKAIAVPTTLVSVIGTVVFVLIIKDIRAEQDLAGARAAELALNIARRTSVYLRNGLTVQSAGKTAQFIYELAEVDAVAITNKENILAFIGSGSDHHKVGEKILASSTQTALDSRHPVIFNTSEEQGCIVPECPLQSGIVAPLIVGSEVVGTIKIAKTQKNSVTSIDTHIVDGLASLLSAQIELDEIEQQKKLRERAELKALQAQINPHFIFNTINIIISFCRTDPNMARELLGHLATMMQFNFSEHGEFISLNEEIEGIHAYLEIAKARFGPRLTVGVDVINCEGSEKLPVLFLQPIVENAILHGLFPKIAECHLKVEIRRTQQELSVEVYDNGVGMERQQVEAVFAEQTDGIGLVNVQRRLIGLYGKERGLQIQSKVGQGTTVRMQIPLKEATRQYAV